MKASTNIILSSLFLCLIFLAACNRQHYQPGFAGKYPEKKRSLKSDTIRASNSESITVSISEDNIPVLSDKYKQANNHTISYTTTKPDNKLSKQEKKIIKQQIKTRIKEARKEAKRERISNKMVLLIILSILLPPLAVYLYENAITTNFWVDLVLTLLIWVPGVVFALLVIFGEISLK